MDNQPMLSIHLIGEGIKLPVFVPSRMVAGYPNYDESVFDAPAPISNDDAFEQIWNSEHRHSFRNCTR
jgi:hypothetical protein